MTTTTYCSTRLSQILNPTPPSRFIPTSPYPLYSSYELDMRRKAEILKYNNNNSNTKTNNLTKKQQLSYVVSRFSGGGVSAELTKKCSEINNTKSIPLPNYYSGVPGPITMLYYNPDIPLYKYSSVIPTLGDGGSQ